MLRIRNEGMESLDERESLAKVLDSLDAPTLRQILLDLAEDHQVVCDQLHRQALAANPAALTRQFTRELDRWRDDHRYIRLEATTAFGHELDVWLAQVEREVLPQFPAQAMALFEAFIELDRILFERVDDSGDAVGSTLRQACGLWLTAARKSGMAWFDIAARAAALYAADDYGARRPLAELTAG